AGLNERVHHAQTLDGTDLLLTLAVGNLVVQVFALSNQVEVLQTLLDRLGAHEGFEVDAEAVLQLVEDRVLRLQVADLEGAEVFPHALQLGDLLVEGLAGLAHLLLCGVLGATLDVGFGTLFFQGGQVGLELQHAVGDAGIALLLQLGDLQADLVLEAGHVSVTAILVDGDDHVGGEVDDLLEVFRRHVEQVAEAAGDTLEVPDVRDRGGQLNVAHALAAHRGLGDLYATTLTDDALEANALVLSTRTFPVTGRPEDLFAEQAILLGLQGAVVDGFGFLDLTVRPATDVVSGGQANTNLIERSYVEQFFSLRQNVKCGWPGLDLVDRRVLEPGGNVDAQLLSGTEDLVVRVLEADGLAVSGQHLDVQAEGLHFLDQNLERLGNARLLDVLALDDCLVHLDPAEDVVGLDGQEFLQCVCRTIGLERPHFHLTETLPTELRLTTQRLLRDHRVRTGRTSVDLVVDQVV